MIGRVSVQRAPDTLAHRAARTVAADQVPGLHGLDLSFVCRIKPLEPGSYWVGIGLVRAGDLVDLKIDETPRVIRCQLRRRSVHDIEIEIMHPGLVQNDMRELR